MKWWEKAWTSCPFCHSSSVNVTRTKTITTYRYPCGTSIFVPSQHAAQPRLYAYALFVLVYLVFLMALSQSNFISAALFLAFFIGVAVALRRMRNET